MIKRISAILAAVLLLMTLPLAGSAAGRVVREPAGRITVKAVYDGTPLTGMKLSAIVVGELLETDNGNQEFSRVFSRKSLNDALASDPKALADELYKFVKNNTHVTFTRQEAAADSQGNVVFQNLQPGVYLILQQEVYKKNGQEYAIPTHFLVTLPYDGAYQVDVAAKAALDIYAQPDATQPGTPSGGSGSGGKLPQTGQMKWPVPVLACNGMLLFALGWFLYRSAEKEDYET